MQILIVDNNIDPDSWGASELCAMARLAPGATIRVRRAPQRDLPERLTGYDRIIVSGSRTSLEEAPWIDRLDELIRRAVSESRPLLGICYGHQALARALGGKHLVRRAERPEYGWGRVEITDPSSPLLRGLPPEFHTFQAHQDEVSELPAGMRGLARSDRCAIQACAVEGRPAFGVQFHPERPLESGERSLARRLKENPRAECLNRGKGRRLFDARIGESIFRNFISLEEHG
jgi:GMP synthase (glutamine-hydrolysing)